MILNTLISTPYINQYKLIKLALMIIITLFFYLSPNEDVVFNQICMEFHQSQ